MSAEPESNAATKSSTFRRGLPQFLAVGVKNMLLFGIILAILLSNLLGIQLFLFIRKWYDFGFSNYFNTRHYGWKWSRCTKQRWVPFDSRTNILDKYVYS